MLDAGTAMFRDSRHLTAPTLDIFLTHAHLDHVVGLTFLFDVLYEKKMKHVFVHGDAAQAAGDRSAPVRAGVVSRSSRPSSTARCAEAMTLSDGAVLTHFPLEHPGGSLGFRIDWPDRSLAYVTDTAAARRCPLYREDPRRRRAGARVLLPRRLGRQGRTDRPQLHHPVAQVAKAADVGRMLLVHVNPLSEEDDPIGLDVARAIFPNTEIAEDGQEIEF